ncbi:VOC family protein [Mucilaginibacter sp.]|uniref:VOC family protein n=1 Tax=Mucilaginibacter sp. TaxID=1882438 RepID=UPI003B006299
MELNKFLKKLDYCCCVYYVFDNILIKNEKIRFCIYTSKRFKSIKAFYRDKLGFELSEISNPEACILKYNKGEASFAIRKPIENLDGKELGVGASHWFAIDENIEELQSQLSEKGVTILGTINNTPFGKTLMVKDPDGYIITFLETKYDYQQ